ncbi:helix-turn-helix domain-containing protein [Actinophytocola gossypii]|uniref:ImmA/IrrE family metallo-endopeptidase n=1 Tax=Actinophytocola gossypii TaxID=2812003 RepID=A0ABT2JJF9_9PSEU|nr:XRE family transcriptional regulator [Actinophytocola gossypii]MCT2587530.1 ImmA/IrrE family metallo-endopeptidase [Actinophytocola gossypii]
MSIDPEVLGQRITEARARAGLTQVQLAAAVSLDRSALAKIETGQRRVSALELARLAETVDVRIEWFVRDAPQAVISRRNAQEPGAANARIDSLAERITREVEFVLGLDDKLVLSLTPAHAVPENVTQAEELAATARHAIGMHHNGPCTGLATKVEQLGLLVFSLDLGVESADAATVLLRQGGIAVINGGLRVGRRRLALAHELGHYLVADDYTVDWRIAEHLNAEQRESILDRFARAFLLPEPGLRAEWADHTAQDGDLRTAAVRLASSYQVDMATLARRLVELGLVSPSEASRIRTISTTRADIVELDLVVGEELSPPALPRPYERAVLRLFRSESISAARALDLLLDTWTDDMLPDLPTRPADQIWQYI